MSDSRLSLRSGRGDPIRSCALATCLLAFPVLGASGALDLNFDPGRGADDIVRAIVLESGGSMIIAGSFRRFDTQDCAGLVRLRPDGRLDPAFAPAGDGVKNALALEADGRILVGGHFSTLGGTARRHLARVDAQGEIDPDFAPFFGAEDSLWVLAIQDDGRILVGGSLSEINGVSVEGVTRLLPTGERDPEFELIEGVDGSVGAVAVLPDGRVLVGGDFGRFGGSVRAGIVRLGPDGRVDEAFDAGLAGALIRIDAMHIQGDGAVVVGGRFSAVQGVGRRGLARLDPEGIVDPLYAGAGGVGEYYDEVRCLVPESGGRVWAAGSFERMNGVQARNMALLDPDGAVVPEFRPCGGVAGGLVRVVVQADGHLVLIGDFSTINHVQRYGIGRILGRGASAPEEVAREIRLSSGALQVRFDTNPGWRYTLEASTDLTEWEAWVSGEFAARSVSIPIPMVSFGDQQFFRVHRATTLEEVQNAGRTCCAPTGVQSR